MNDFIMEIKAYFSDEINSLSIELRTWEKSERAGNNELMESLETMSQGKIVHWDFYFHHNWFKFFTSGFLLIYFWLATEKTSVCVSDMLNATKKRVFPAIREINRYNQSVLQMLRRRNNMAYEWVFFYLHFNLSKSETSGRWSGFMFPLVS